MKSILTGLSILATAIASVGYCDSAQEAYRLGHYQTAGSQLKPNDPMSQFYLGKLRLYGYGVLKNNTMALEYFTNAANHGYLPAQQLMGRYALMIQNDPSNALVWFKKAADQGDNEARMYCAAAYLFGYGTNKNPDIARKFYIDAAKAGVPLAQYTLGKYFLESKDKNSKKLGLLWLTKAANQGHAPSQVQLGLAELQGVGGSEADPSQAKTWLDKAAQQGNNDALLQLGQIAIQEKNFEEAKTNFLKANQPQNPMASLALAKLYLIEGTPTYQPQAALELLKTTVDKPSLQFEEASGLLAMMYDKGIGTVADPKAAEQVRQKIVAHQKARVPTQLTSIIDWLTEQKTQNIQQTPYTLNGILTQWQSPEAKKNNRYNQAPKMPELTRAELFKPQFSLIEPNSIPITDYLEKMVNYTGQNTPTLQEFPQYKLEPLFENLKYHDSLVLNHEHDNEFIYPETLLNQANDENTNILSLLELAPKDQNRRLNYQRALLELYHRAILGESAAQFQLGQLYQAGVAVAQNPEQAINYYELAALQQELRAEYNLGLLYLSGQTNPIDYKKGVDWLTDAAFKGNSYAQYALGSLYRQGLNDTNNKVLIQPNEEQAIAMYYLASANNFAPGEYELANVLLKQNQTNFNVASRTQRQKFIKELYQEALDQGMAEAQLPLAFYQAQSNEPQEQAKAFVTASQHAQSGNLNAALLLGLLYDRGIGHTPSQQDAIQWYKQAINHPVAAFILGTYASKNPEDETKKQAKSLLSYAADHQLSYADYNLAILNHQNHEEFLPNLTKARQEGNPTAGLLLADYYLNQSNQPNHLQEAQTIYQEFAKKGDPTASTKLAYMLDHGMGGSANPGAAESWYLVAAKQKQPQAQFLLGELYQSGRINGQANINEAKSWYTAAAQRGQTMAPVALGFIQETVDENFDQAAESYKNASAAQPIALYNLGLMARYGKGRPVDLTQAYNLFSQAANAGDVNAMTELGKLYQYGLGTTKDSNAAEQWFKKAAEQQSADAWYHLGLLANTQPGTTEKQQQAAQAFEQAMNLGHEKARYKYAQLLFNGHGVAKDEAKAIDLLTYEANHHNSDAAIELAKISIQRGQLQQAQRWVEQARQAGNPKAEAILNQLKTSSAPKTSALNKGVFEKPQFYA